MDTKKPLQTPLPQLQTTQTMSMTQSGVMGRGVQVTDVYCRTLQSTGELRGDVEETDTKWQ
jgi:hypothetical protein